MYYVQEPSLKAKYEMGTYQKGSFCGGLCISKWWFMCDLGWKLIRCVTGKGREVNERSCGRQKSFARVCAKLFWSTIYCANPSPEHDSQLGSLSCRWMGRRVLHIMHEYNCAIYILIRPLIHPRTCKMGSSIFTAMIQLKFTSKTRASFTSMPSTEKKNWEFLSIDIRNAYCACLYFLFTTDPGVVSLAHSFWCPSTSPQIWHQW